MLIPFILHLTVNYRSLESNFVTQTTIKVRACDVKREWLQKTKIEKPVCKPYFPAYNDSGRRIGPYSEVQKLTDTGVWSSGMILALGDDLETS